MNYTSQLPRCRFQARARRIIASSALLWSCAAEDVPSGPGTDPDGTPPVLSPAAVSLPFGAPKQFVTVRRSKDGATVALNPHYAATGGTVSSSGLYTAGQVVGTYRVIATDTTTGLADTSTITITADSSALQTLALTPTAVSLTAGGNQQFSAVGEMSDGSTGPVQVNWIGTGGTISSEGLYTAAEIPGSYRVIASAAGGTLADTATIDITSPSPSPVPGLPIFPGQSIQTAVNAHGAGTSFLIKAGRHVRQSVVPKAGNVFRCEAGAVMDGENATPYAFHRSGAGPNSVHIIGCRIIRYKPPVQMGAILAAGYTASDGATGWILDSCEVDSNANVGIRMGHRMKVRWSKVRYNGQLGISGIGESIMVEGTEIAYNNPTGTGLGFEAGGTKFVLTTALVLRNNFVHHNEGPGLWTDIDNDGYLIEGNRVEDNRQEGIVTEISYSGVIRNNLVRRNGLRDSRRTSWLWGAGIGVHGSGGDGIEIYQNTLEDNAHGIALLQQNRGSGGKGRYQVQNVWAHDNVVVQPWGASGAVQDVGDNAIFTSRNNRFTNNTYRVSTNAHPFTWMNAWLDEGDWTSFGQD